MNQSSSAAPRKNPAVLAFALWSYRRLLCLHPASFRREYGTEIYHVFAQSCRAAWHEAGAAGVTRLWLSESGDLLLGALAEHLDVGKGSFTMPTYRRSLSTIFAAYIAFVIAGIGFQKMTEDVMKSSLPAAHPILEIAYLIVAGGAALSLLAVLVGGLPLAWSAARYAFAHQRGDILIRFAVPPVALAVVWGYLMLLIHLDPGGATPATIHSPARILGVASLGLVFIVAAFASTSAVLSAIARSEIDPRLYRFAMLPGLFTTVLMVAMLLGVVAWFFGLWLASPSAYLSGNDGVLATNTALNSLVPVLLMLAAIAVAGRATLRGMRGSTPQQAA